MSPVDRTSSAKVRRVAVVGAGPSGLSAALKLAQSGIPVDVISASQAARCASVAWREGISAVLPERSGNRSDDDSVRRHVADIVREGDGLSQRPLALAMAQDAAAVVGLLDRAGVPFDRTPEGELAAHKSIGASHRRMFGAGSATGQLTVLALDDQLRRLEAELVRDARGMRIPGEPVIRRLAPWDFVRLVRDDGGVAVGIVAQDLRSMTIAAFPYDAIVLATGGFASVFAGAATGRYVLGGAVAAVFEQGAALANAELAMAHSLAIAGPDKARALPEWLRAEGARIFTPKDESDTRDPGAMSERERTYLPALADLANPPSAHVAAAAIAAVRARGGRVFLDLIHRKADHAFRTRVAGVSALCERFAGKGLLEGPVEIVPAVARTLGGLFIDFERDAHGAVVASSPRSHATNIPGLYAAGGAASGYHGAGAAPADVLLADMVGGRLAAAGVSAYRQAMVKSAFDLPSSLFDKAQKLADDAYRKLLAAPLEGAAPESIHTIYGELAETMTRDAGFVRSEAGLASAAETIAGLRERLSKAAPSDSGSHVNQAAPFARHLAGGLTLALALVESARARNASTGMHQLVASPAHDAKAPKRVTLALHHGEHEVKIVSGLDYACAGKTVAIRDIVDDGGLATEVADG